MSMALGSRWRQLQDYIMITLGTFLAALGICAFILPEKVVVGGVTGIGTIVYYATGWPLAIGVVQYGINLVLLVFAWFTVGKRFVGNTIYGATMLSVFIAVIPYILPHTVNPDGSFLIQSLVPGQPFMNIIIGSLFEGIGLGLVLASGGSTGGTDIVATMVVRKSNVSIGRIMLLVDCCIISSSFIIFREVPTVVYGYINLILSTYMVDMVINTNRQTIQFTIFSKDWEDIAKAIGNYQKRGVTIIDGMGWYARKSMKILLVYSRKSERISIYRIIKSIDPDAFVSQANVSSVYGKGFDHIHLKDDEELTREVKKVVEE